jgi:hypothetical protein
LLRTPYVSCTKMKWIDKLEKRFGHLAIHNLALYLVIGQVFVFALINFGRMASSTLYLNSTLVLNGEIWRLFTFMLIPPRAGMLLIAFAWYIFWMISQALEAQWGTFKYNLFLLIGVLATWLASLLLPLGFFTNYYIGISVFLAFATLYPNFEFLLFFILPVKVKYLAWLSLGYMAVVFLQPSVATRFEIIAALANYALFFGKDLYQAMYYRKRRSEHQKEKKAYVEKVFHICATCGATDKSNPEREFRYKDGDGICSDCLEKESTSSV